MADGGTNGGMAGFGVDLAEDAASAIVGTERRDCWGSCTVLEDTLGEDESSIPSTAASAAVTGDIDIPLMGDATTD